MPSWPHLQAAGDAQGRRAGAGRARRLRQAASPIPTCCCPGWRSRASRPWSPSTPRSWASPSAQMADMASVAPAPQMPEAQRPAPAARAKSNKPFTADDYETIRTEAALDEWIAEATKAGVVGFDLEADARRCGLVGLSFALLEGPWGNVNSGRRRAAYLPIGHRRRRAQAQGALDLGGAGKTGGDSAAARPARARDRDREAEAAARGPGRAQGRPRHQVRHRVLERHGITIAPVDDTMLLSFVLDGGKHSHGMDDLAERYLDHKTDQVLRRRRLRRQAGELRQGADRARPRIRRRARRRHARSSGRSSSRGSPPSAWSTHVRDDRAAADPGAARHGAGRHQGRCAAAQAAVAPTSRSGWASSRREIHKIAGREFNVGSPKQLGEILFDEQKLPGGRRNKTGAWSTDA